MSLADSPFVDRLNTNYVPSESEIPEICALLVDPTAELAKLDAQIQEIEITLSQLKEKRTLLKAPIDAHRALISPMRHVPLDVLHEIFLSCLPSEHNALIDPAEAPLLLGRICRHWRSVSHATPMLWSSIHIPFLSYRYHSPTPLSKLAKLVEAWLERSATCSLSVSLFDPTNQSDPNSETHPLISQLLSISSRIRHLKMSGDAQLLRPLLQLGAEDLSVLKSIRIELTANKIFENHTEAAIVFQIPTLEDVSLHIVEVVEPLSLPLRWSALTGLNLQCYRSWTENGQEGGVDLSGLLDVLRRCPNLRRCQLQVTKTSEIPLDTTPIILPEMHTLVLLGSLYFEKWISHLVVPKLRCLQVGDVREASRLWDPYMRAYIDPNCFTSSGFRELLQSFPMLSDLRLSSATYYHGASISPNNAFLTALHDLCPILTHFTVLPGAGLSEAALLALIRARMAMPTPLQQVQLHFFWPLDPEIDIEPDLQPFISDGLQVGLQYAPQARKFNPREGLYPSTSLY